MTDGKRTLLLVEDEALIAMHQKTVLEKHGFEVTTAMRPEQVVSKFSESGADLILMDIDLGSRETDGTRLAERILEWRDVPIVFLTSHAEKEYVDRARSITRYGYVLKNSGEFVLTQAIEMAFELFGTHRELREEMRTRREAEERLVEEEAELSAIYEHTPVLMVLVDAARVVRKANAAAAAFAGGGGVQTTSSRIGQVLRCLHRLDSEQGCGFGEFCLSCPIRNTVLETLTSGHGADRVEAELPGLQDGSRPFACYSLSTAYLEIRGEPFAIVSLEDITELKDTERALEESRSEYEECYRDLPVMLHSIDPEGRILDVNGEWLATLGYTREEVVGRKSVDFLTPESRRFALGEALPEFFRKGRARDVPHRFRKKDGEPVDVILSAIAQRDRQGAITRSVAVSLKTADAAAIR